MTQTLKRISAATAAAASLLAVVLPGTAPAASVTYIKDNNVWITNSEGTYHRQITTNGTANAPYRTPTQTDSGVIYAAGPQRFFYRFNQDGSSAGTPLLQPGGSCSTSPTGAQARPSGGLIAYSYVSATCTTTPNPHQRVTAIDANVPTINESIWPSWRNYIFPRWINKDYMGYISLDGTRIDAEPEDHRGDHAPRPWLALTPDAQGQYTHTIESFDVDRTGTFGLIETESKQQPSPTGQPWPSIITLWWNTHAPIPAQVGQVVCTSNVPSWAQDAKPRFSPDGNQIVFSTPEGVFVSPIPKASDDGSCHLQFKLIAPGGSDADFGAKDLDVPGGPGGTGGPGAGGPGTGGPGTDGPDAGGPGPNGPNGPNPPADSVAPAVVVAKPAGKLTAALKKGQAVTVGCDEACAIDAQLLLPGKASKKLAVGSAAAKKTTIVATGKGKLAGAGKAKVVLRFTKAGAKALKKKRSVKLLLQVTVKDGAGNVSAKNVPVTLKR
jgi:hypothetical protein